MRLPRLRWYALLFLGFLGLMSVQASRLLRAAPPTTPRPTDAAAARRVALAPGAQADEREAAPPVALAAGNGVVEPAQPEVRLGAPVAGSIARVMVREGDRVEAGAPLIELDRRVEAAALAAAEADVLGARAELDRVIKGTRAEDIRAARGEADAARARAALAQSMAARTERAAAAGALTGDELDRARREAEAAEAASRVATAREQASIAGSRREDVQLARARLAAVEARRDQAAAAHARLLITAPAAGEVLQLPYRVGEYYQPGGQARSEPLAVVGDTSQLRVRVDIDERDIGKIQPGAPVLVRASAFPGQDLRGRIVEIGRRMGRKNVRTDDPTERNDTKILEVVVALEAAGGLIVGQRVTSYVLASPR